MIRHLLLLFALLFVATPLMGQEPVLKVEVNETETIPGQNISLRLTVLAPTYMLQPPVWPDFDAPNLRVKTISTGPAFGQVDGKDWTGVTRRYSVTPLVQGEISLPVPDIGVTWADPETNKPLQTKLPIQPITVSGVIPPEASGLDPFLAARSIKLTQEIQGNPTEMVPGDSLTRVLRAEIEGASPVFIPTLLLPVTTEGLQSYPEDPVFDETDNRGMTGGTRVDQITYTAEGGGTGKLPEVMLRWYDLDTGKIETSRIDAVSYTVKGPPVSHSEPRNWRVIILVVAATIGGAALLFWLLRHLVIWTRLQLQNAHAKWQASEARAWKELCSAVHARDLTRMTPALDKWAARQSASPIRSDPRLIAALTNIGRNRYARSDRSNDAKAWQELERLLRQLRIVKRQNPDQGILPSLNAGYPMKPRDIET